MFLQNALPQTVAGRAVGRMRLNFRRGEGKELRKPGFLSVSFPSCSISTTPYLSYFGILKRKKKGFLNPFTPSHLELKQMIKCVETKIKES